MLDNNDRASVMLSLIEAQLPAQTDRLRSETVEGRIYTYFLLPTGREIVVIESETSGHVSVLGTLDDRTLIANQITTLVQFMTPPPPAAERVAHWPHV